MIVKLSTGRSFKGLLRYITHDARGDASRQPETSERVGWTEIRHMPGCDIELAAGWMAATVSDADYLKRKAGVTMGGAPAQEAGAAHRSVVEERGGADEGGDVGGG